MKTKISKVGKKKHNRGSIPFQMRLNIIFLILVIVPLAIMSAIVIKVMTIQFEEQGKESSSQYLNQGTDALETRLREIDNLVHSTFWNNEMQKAMWINENIENSEEINYLVSNLRGIKNVRKDVQDVWIEGVNGQIYAPEGTKIDYPERHKVTWGKRGQFFWRKSLEEGKIIGSRELYDLDNLQQIGTFYILLKESYICDTYSDLKTTEGSFFVIFDGNKNMISTNSENKENFEGFMEQWDNMGESIIKIGSIDYYISHKMSEYLGWDICLFTPKSEMMRNVKFVRILFISICIIIIGIMLIAANLLSEYITDPIRRMTHLTEEVQKGNFKVQMEVLSEDEFGSLAKSFNAMVRKTNYLIEEVYKNEILLRETEYKYLQAQINPHFLYNTLDSISWLANMAGSRDISKMSVSLGKIMRWAISNNRTVVTLGEELQNLEAYMTIQRIRYSERVEDTIDIPDELREYYVPKMILQPMVENALIHGLENKVGMGYIYVIARKMQGKLCITIRDNGVGISEQRMKEIVEKNKFGKQSQSSIGIDNVNQRIKMVYGPQFGLDVESVYGKGTAVHMWLGMTKNREDLEKREGGEDA